MSPPFTEEGQIPFPVWEVLCPNPHQPLLVSFSLVVPKLQGQGTFPVEQCWECQWLW